MKSKECCVYFLIFENYKFIRLITKNNTKISAYFNNDNTIEWNLFEISIDKNIDDLTNLSTEEYFQLMTVWDYSTDLDFVIAAQRYIFKIYNDSSLINGADNVLIEY